MILDSSVLIAAERGAIDLATILDGLGKAPLGIAAITASELLHGVHRAVDAGTRARRAASVESMLGLLPVYAFGLREARRHAELWAHLKQRGALIGSHDMLIAATAIARGESLVTLYAGEFGRVPGLTVIAVNV